MKAERARIGRAIAAALLAAGPVSLMALACSSSSNNSASGTGDSGAGAEAALDSNGEIADVGVACNITVTTFDSGNYYDAEAGGVDVGCIYELPCGLPPTVVALGCQVYTPDPLADAFYPLGCTITEGNGCTDGSFTAADGGLVGIICRDCMGGGGRRPRGLKKAQFCRKNGPVSYFARMAFEEHASVNAFVRMEEELAQFGAPQSLRRAARRAANDERRHARVMRKLAIEDGALGPTARVAKPRRRSLEAMAIENAVEGCVNETYGALLLRFQAARSTDARLGATLSAIADDEMRHAALSWAVARWIDTKLDAPAQRRVHAARSRAAHRLATSPLAKNLFDSLASS
ncbi:MAG: hypothetical protein ACRELY_14290 [Polyangiaceae bacterium]